MLLAALDIAEGYAFLDEQLNQFVTRADVYSDAGAEGNLFVPNIMNAVPPVFTPDFRWTDNVHEGNTCIKLAWTGQAGDDGWKWAGVGFQWPFEPTAGSPGLGWDLSQATKLEFWARTEVDGERIEVGVGDDTLDSFEPVRQVVSLGNDPANNGWRKYTVPLSGLNLSNLHLGFVVALKDDGLDFGEPGGTVYIDSVSFDCPSPEPLQLMQSYRPSFGLSQRDEGAYAHTAFSYDNAVAVLAYLTRGLPDDIAKASRLVQTFHWILTHESLEEDLAQYLGPDEAFVRSEYNPGPMHFPGQDGPRHGFWTQAGGWQELSREANVGVNAWVMLALLEYAQRTGQSVYLNDALRIGNWIYNNFRDQEHSGFTLGILEVGGGLVKPTGSPKSTEHNADCHAAFARLADAFKEAHNLKAANLWRKRAREAGDLVARMYDPAAGRFYVGTVEDGITPKTTEYALDSQSWPVLSMRSEARYRRIKWAKPLQWAEQHLSTTSFVIPEHPVEGFAYGISDSQQPQGVWLEGTAHMVAAYASLSEKTQYDKYLTSLATAQELHAYGDGKGIVAAMEDGTPTLFGDNSYDARLHVGATAWALLAAQRANPFDLEDAVELTNIPAYGSLGALQGRVNGLSPLNCRLATYIRAGGGWYSKPTFAHPYTRISRSGVWTCPIVTGGVDHLATSLAAFVIPDGASAPLVNGLSDLPDELFASSNAFVQFERLPDLLATVTDVSLPQVAQVGDRGAVSVRLLNGGFALSGRYLRMTVFASQDDTLDPLVDVPLGNLDLANLTLAWRQDRDCTIKVALPSLLEPGQYNLLAVVDVRDQIVESDETNNTAVGPAMMQIS